SPQIDVTWDLPEIRRSLEFISQHGSEADARAIHATAKIFGRTNDNETRRACLESLSRITNPKARAELLRILEQKDLDQTWRDLISSLLTNPNQRLDPLTSSIKAGANRVEQQ
ncbi:MAG: hypothetical protein ACRD6N_07120, partial [Pyrinomonadaceae bacterium]